MKFSNIARKSKARGQGMTEYIIIVALIAVAAIGVYSMFGETVKRQTGSMAAALGGDNKNAVQMNKDAAKVVETNKEKVNENKNLSDFAKNNELDSK
jgi:Flp pilus assembly pilin Flp